MARTSLDEYMYQETRRRAGPDFTKYFNPRVRGFAGQDAQFPWTKGQVIVKRGEVTFRGLGAGGQYHSLDFKKGISGSDVGRQITEYAAGITTEFLKEKGIAGNKDVSFNFIVGGASGRSAALGSGLFVGGSGSFQEGADYTGLTTMGQFDDVIKNLISENTLSVIKAANPESPQDELRMPDPEGTAGGLRRVTMKRKEIAKRRQASTGRSGTILTTGNRQRLGV